MTGPVIKDRRLAAGLGVAMLAGGWLLLHDAYVRGNRRPPLLLRPLMPFR